MAKKTTIVAVSINTGLLEVLRETVKAYDMSLSKFIEALLVSGGERLNPPLPYTPKTPNTQESVGGTI